MMSTATKSILLIVGVVILLGGALYYFTLFQDGTNTQTSQSHLIEGVPYTGAYTTVELVGPSALITHSVLGYWNDERLTLSEVATRLRADTAKNTGYGEIGAFFTSRGYDAQVLPAPSLEAMKPLLRDGVPIMLIQQFSTTQPEEISGPLPEGYEQYAHTMRVPQDVFTPRLVIGYSDTERTVEVHDTLLGNNYTMSYEQFELLSVNPNMLVVRPSETLKSTLGAPGNRSASYERDAFYDDPGFVDIQVKIASVLSLREHFERTGEPTAFDIIRLHEATIDHEAFALLRPIDQMRTIVNLALFYTGNSRQYQEAVDLIENRALGLAREQQAVWQAEYDLETVQWLQSTPYVMLGFAYKGLGEVEKSEEMLALAESIDSESVAAWERHLYFTP